MLKTPTLFCDDGSEIELPFKWAICSRCEGCGTDRGASVESDGGGITADEMAELGEEFKQDYLRGFYDKTCDYCGGSGKIKIADHSKMTREQRRNYASQERSDREIDAIEAAERRAGC